MSISPVCDICDEHLEDFGAIVLSPPEDENYEGEKVAFPEYGGSKSKNVSTKGLLIFSVK